MTNIINFPTTATIPATKKAGSVETVTGSKFAATSGMDLAAVAKLVRADIKAAVKAGQLTAGDYSVTISRYSMGQSMDVTVKACALTVVNAARVAAEMTGADGYDYPRYSDEGKALLSTLEGIMAQYNRSASDSHSDYSNVKFYGDAKFAGALENAQRANIQFALNMA